MLKKILTLTNILSLLWCFSMVAMEEQRSLQELQKDLAKYQRMAATPGPNQARARQEVEYLNREIAKKRPTRGRQQKPPVSQEWLEDLKGVLAQGTLEQLKKAKRAFDVEVLPVSSLQKEAVDLLNAISKKIKALEGGAQPTKKPVRPVSVGGGVAPTAAQQVDELNRTATAAAKQVVDAAYAAGRNDIADQWVAALPLQTYSKPQGRK